MSGFQDPSIISMVPSEQESSKFFGAAPSSTEPIAEDNAILKFLREGEKKKEQEEKQEQKNDAAADISKTLAEAESKKQSEESDGGKYITPDRIKNRKIEIEDWNFTFKNENVIRYTPSQLLSIRESGDIPTADQLPLPNKDYYRFKNRLPQQHRRDWNSNTSSYNSNNSNGRNYDNTGAMGNFNLGKSGRGHNNNNSSNNRHRGERRNNRSKKHDDLEWLNEFDKDAPAAGSAEDFEKYKARVMNEEKKKRGEVVEQPKDKIESFFGVSAQSTGASSVGVDAKNSRFFSMFAKDESPQIPAREVHSESTTASSDNVSKFFGGGAAAAAAAAVPGARSQTPLSQGSEMQRSQFFSQSGGGAPSGQAPPGLDRPAQGGSKDSFFMSLMGNKAGDATQKSPSVTHSPQQQQSTPQTPQAVPQTAAQGISQVPSQPQLQQLQHSQPQQQQLPQDGNMPDSKLPPGLQAGPLPNFDAGAPPPGLQQGQFPPKFNGQRPQQGQVPFPQGISPQQLPPGLSPGQIPPWINPQQLPPNMRQFPPQGRFMPPQGMPPQGMPPQGFPPGMRPPQGIPPQMMFQQGQGMPPMFMPPQGEGDGRGGAPPGFFGPPPGFPVQNQPQQGEQKK